MTKAQLKSIEGHSRGPYFVVGNRQVRAYSTPRHNALIAEIVEIHPEVDGYANVNLLALAPQLLAERNALLKAYGKLHDMLSDMIEGRRLSVVDIPDDYQALVDQLSGPCAVALTLAES